MFLLLRSVVSSLFWCRLVPISWSPHPAWEVGEAGSAGVGRERVGARETCPKLVVGGKGRVSEPCPDVDWLAACLGCRALFTLPCRAPAGVVAPCLRVFRRRFDRGIHWGGVVASGCVDPSRVCCGGHLGCSLLVVDGGARFLQHVVRSVAFVVKAALFSFVLFLFFSQLLGLLNSNALGCLWQALVLDFKLGPMSSILCINCRL